MENPNGCYVATVGTLSHMTGVEIAEELKMRQESPSESEYRSWCNSIPVLVDVIHRAGLDELTLILEYTLPMREERIDALLVGEERSTGKPLLLVIELKQWETIGINGDEWESYVPVCISRDKKQYEKRRYPVQQTLTYSKHLRMNHSSVTDGKMKVRCCQFLHNFENKELLFQGNYREYAEREKETYGKGEEAELAEYLREQFLPRPSADVAERFLSGTHVIGQDSIEVMKRDLSRAENMVLLDDQIEVNKKVYRKLTALFENPSFQELVVISGPPGTGKTIVGEHILYTYYNLCRQPGRKKSPMCRCAFALARSRTLFAVLDESGGVSPVYLENLIDPKREERWDLVVVDEAHRIGDINGTMKKLFQKARLVVVLQDDHQRIMMSEEGTLENFRRYAEDSGISFSTFSLASQKRSGYLGSYISDVDQLLYERREQIIRQTSALELCCWDDLNDLDRHLHQLLTMGHHVKWYAPFCWKWSFDTKIKDIHIRQASGNFEKPWNPFPKEMQYNWYVGKKEEYLDQVGCIYTAQGLEFDDIGVIWWDDLRWDENIHDWRVDLSSSCDKQFMAAIRNSRPSEREIVELVLNTYRVMLTRAKGSVHIWFRDWKTREHVRKVMGF